MSSQKNRDVAHIGNPLYAATGALFSILLASQSNWIWACLYFQLQTIEEIVLAFAAMAGMAVVGIWLLNRLLGQAVTLKVVNFVLVVMLFFVLLFICIKEMGFIPHALASWQKALAVVLASLIALMLVFRIGTARWVRIYPAAIVASIGFTFFPWLFASGSAPVTYWPSPSRQAATVAAPPVPAQNTIILLLDEFSASVAAPVIDGLKEAGLYVNASSIAASGQDTVNVIPAIWSRTNFDRSAACGPTQLCSGGHVLDFAKIKASADNIDIVAFYHRYCSIQGLRSCQFYPFPKKPAITELACRLLLMPSFGPLDCKPSEADREYFSAQRENMQQTLMAAPFWQKGGILYAHLLQPHPLMGLSTQLLSVEYAGNIDNSAIYIKRIAQKARAAFGDNFSIVIFSDHPLRPEMWCGTGGFYAADKCRPTPAQLSNRVPLIIATPKPDKKSPLGIENNRAVFDLIFK